MRDNIFVSTTRYQDVSLEQEGLMTVDNAGMITPECAFTSKQEDAKREIIVISTMEERELAAGHQIHTKGGIKK